MSEENKKSNSPDPVAAESNTRPAPPPAAPTKKFPRAEDKNAKRGPGRPPKVSPQRGGASTSVGASRAGESPAAVPSPASYAPKPTPQELGQAGTRGLMQMTAGICAGITWAALKVPYFQALSAWQFTDRELDQIEKPGSLILEKYAPYLDAWGVELEFAGVLLPILTGKMFAIIAMKQALEARQDSPPAGVASKGAPVSEIRPAKPPEKRESAAAAPEHTSHGSAESPAQADSPGAPPSAFAHNAVDRSAELLSL
jgi:hypothetical protein